MNVLLALFFGYLIGSISFARIITKIVKPGSDVTKFEVPVDGSNETYQVIAVGANSVSGELGAKWGMVVALLDILKVFLTTLAFRLVFPHDLYFLMTALAGMAGHIWPVYYRFHGGAGFSAAVGGLLAVDWLSVIVTPIAGVFLGVVLLRNIGVASLSWMWLLIPWLWLRSFNIWYVLFAVGVNILFYLAMIPEFKVMFKYKNEGRLKEYSRGYLKSNPMGRGYLKLAKIFHIEV